MGSLIWAFYTLATPLMLTVQKTPQQGAWTPVHIAVAPELATKNITGKYFMHCEDIPATGLANDEDLARELWEFSAKAVGLSAKKQS